MEPKTLDEALVVINELREKNKTVIQEKKDAIKLFTDKERENLTDTENKLSQALEEANQRIAELTAKTEAESERLIKDQQERTNKLINERIAKVSKGDEKVAQELRNNIDLLEKLPRQTDAEIDELIDKSWALRKTTDVNPLHTINTVTTTPELNKENDFTTTEEGKELASKMGFSFVNNENK